MASGFENAPTSAETISSMAAADLVTGVLEGHVAYLLENNFKNIISENGVDEFHVGVGTLCDLDYEEDVWDGLRREQEESGKIDWVGIARDSETGVITRAWVSTILPASISSHEANGFYRGDGWHARLQFSLGENPSEQSPHVVIDTWRTPLTAVSRAMKALGDNYSEEKLAEYDAFYKSVFNQTNEDGIPLAAQDINHVVLGVDSELDPATYELIKVVLGLFDQGVRDNVAWGKMIGMSSFAEQAPGNDALPASVVDELRAAFAAIRAERQAQKSQVGSPFALLKTISRGAQVELPKKKLRTVEAERRIAAQKAAGAAIRAQRAARRTAAQSPENPTVYKPI